MNITNPCVYHYLFSHIPSYGSEREAKKTAGDLVFRLLKGLCLEEDETQRLRQLSADVILLSSYASEDTETYLSQLLSHDLISTILTYNHTETDKDSLSFLKNKRQANFSETPDWIGETSVFFVQATSDASLAKQIAEVCVEAQIEEPFPFCQFEWGTLYALRYCSDLRGSRQTGTYVLLVPEEEDLKKGDHFLSYLFPIMESIQHKLVFEEQESSMFKANNVRHEQKIKQLLDKINDELRDTLQPPAFEENLKQIATHQAELYQSIAETDALLLTLNINLVNFENTLSTLSLVEDTLFMPLIPEFRFIRQQIEYDLKYIKFLLPGMDKREELLRLKIEWQRKEAEKRSNKIKEFTNALIFSFGVALGIGQMLFNYPHWGLKEKFFVMALGGSVAYALNRFLGMERVKAIYDAFNWPGKIEKNLK